MEQANPRDRGRGEAGYLFLFTISIASSRLSACRHGSAVRSSSDYWWNAKRGKKNKKAHLTVWKMLLLPACIGGRGRRSLPAHAQRHAIMHVSVRSPALSPHSGEAPMLSLHQSQKMQVGTGKTIERYLVAFHVAPDVGQDCRSNKVPLLVARDLFEPKKPWHCSDLSKGIQKIINWWTREAGLGTWSPSTSSQFNSLVPGIRTFLLPVKYNYKIHSKV